MSVLAAGHLIFNLLQTADKHYVIANSVEYFIRIPYRNVDRNVNGRIGIRLANLKVVYRTTRIERRLIVVYRA